MSDPKDEEASREKARVVAGMIEGLVGVKKKGGAIEGGKGGEDGGVATKQEV